jgi:acetyl esterase/lipase
MTAASSHSATIVQARFEARVLRELLPGLRNFAFSDLDLSRTQDVLAALRRPKPVSPDTDKLMESVQTQDHLLPRADAQGELLVRTYRPVGCDEPLPGVVHIHGGGMIRGSVADDQTLAIRLATACRVVAASVEYRLAPEHPFPAAVEDCYQALLWLQANAASVGVDPERIAVSGSSAGGGLAAAIALMARDRSGPRIRLVAMASPMLDDRTAVRDDPEFSGIPGWSAELNAFAWRCLLSDRVGSDEVSFYAAPARAEDLSGLPPTFISLGGLEVFRNEVLDYASRLVRAGVPVELHLYPGAFHAWELVNPSAELSARSRHEREQALRRALHDSDACAPLA